jgi:hypothetical protein
MNKTDNYLDKHRSNNETKTFYLKSETADNSLFEFTGYDEKVEMKCISLDAYLIKNPVKEIFLLKLEAEGTEPEVLKGALKSLGIIKYITVDWGPERGMKQETTLSSVSNLLFHYDFEMVSVNHLCYTALFRNLKIK